jgi:uncharacterized RmlC-like cupin family protein
MSSEARGAVVVLEAPQVDEARQGMPVFFGISEQTAGARGISLNVTSFPPGGMSKAHMHRDYETAIRHLDGRVAIFYGDRLEDVVVLEPGSYCYIPPWVPHKAFNLSSTERAHSVTARNDPREQENVVLTPEADDGSADARVKAMMTS